jgi:aminoglycoside phosphotransferase (APT) family kinase protein
MLKFVAKSDDAVFPQLRLVTDAHAMKEVFQREFPGFSDGRLELRSVTLMQVRYEPGKKCHLCYRLKVKNLATGNVRRPTCFAIVEPNGEAEAQYAKAQRQIHFQPKLLPAVHFLPELNMILWGYPNDPKLKHLHRLINRNSFKELLQGFWNALHLPPQAKLTRIITRRIKYVPRDRCTLRHRLYFDGAERLVIFSKMLNQKTSGELIFKTMQTLWNAPVCQSGAFLIPEPLFFSREMNTIFVRGLKGKNADDHLAELDLNRVAAEVGAGLAGIHQCRIDGLPEQGDAHVMSQMGEAEEILGKFEASYRPRVAALTKTLRDRHPQLPPLAAAPIHSAFRLSQFLIVEGKLALIDFDDFILGNPIADVASFVAHLLYLPLKGELSPERSRAAIREFCRSYAAAAPWGLPNEVFVWQSAAHLLGKQAKKCIRLAKENHAEKVQQLLSLAAAVLEGKERLI